MKIQEPSVNTSSMLRILSFALVLTILISTSALPEQVPANNGQPDNFTKQVNCGSIEGTPEQKDCFNKTYQQADQRLKQVYSRLVAFFELDAATVAERKRRLSRAQEAWVKFRDSNCEFRSSGRKQEQAVFQESCRARMTQERVQELEEFLQRGG